MKSTIPLATLCFLATIPAAAAPLFDVERPGDRGRSRIHCEIAVLGGGAGGLHTAMRLGQKHRGNVCLFEKEDRLGGRIYDIAKTEGGPVFGTGALRVMEGQEVLFSLAQELGISLEAKPFVDDLIGVRGMLVESSDEANQKAYPLLADAETETTLYDKLRFGPERKNARKYPDFRSYVRAVTGSEGFNFLTDVFRFRADFAYPLDARGYLDYLDEEWDVCCTPSYPHGGMSEFIRRMEAKARSFGVRIYKSEPVSEIDWGSRRYQVRTPRYQVSANKLVLGIDAHGLRHVGGDVAEAIKEQDQFQDLIGVKVVTITQFWQRRWWDGVRPGKDTHRAWTMDSCLNFIEIPTASYAANQNVTRSVYTDDIRCVEMWEGAAKRGTAHVEAEIERGLRVLFPGVTLPKAQKTHVQVWPAAWYWLRGGTRFTNKDIAKWAIEPLPGEDISLVGEAYNPQRSGWSDAAYKSSINTLNARYGFRLAGASVEAGKAAALRATTRRSFSQAGR